jgi:hypothetical protein
MMNNETTYQSIINDLIEREKMGVEKYGVTVDNANLTEEQWLQHAYEEALDFAVYIKTLMKKRKDNTNINTQQE